MRSFVRNMDTGSTKQSTIAPFVQGAYAAVPPPNTASATQPPPPYHAPPPPEGAHRATPLASPPYGVSSPVAPSAPYHAMPIPSMGAGYGPPTYQGTQPTPFTTQQISAQPQPPPPQQPQPPPQTGLQQQQQQPGQFAPQPPPFTTQQYSAQPQPPPTQQPQQQRMYAAGAAPYQPLYQAPAIQVATPIECMLARTNRRNGRSLSHARSILRVRFLVHIHCTRPRSLSADAVRIRRRIRCHSRARVRGPRSRLPS